VSEHLEIRRRLAAIGKNRRWLAERLNMSETTVRLYLQPKGKRTKEFLQAIEHALVLEEARQRENRADAPPWNVLFRTSEEFDRVDRASRRVESESVLQFCRDTLLLRANAILAEAEAVRYPAGKRLKVAEREEDLS
jgi:transcriptional regulator with XRE-family HTH domain